MSTLKAAISVIALIHVLIASQFLHAMISDDHKNSASSRERARAENAIKKANNIWYANEYNSAREETYFHVRRSNYESIFLYPLLVQTAADQGWEAAKGLMTDHNMEKSLAEWCKKGGLAIEKYSNSETRDILLLAAAIGGEAHIVKMLLDLGADRNALYKLHGKRQGSILHKVAAANIAPGNKSEIMSILLRSNRVNRANGTYQMICESLNVRDDQGKTALSHVLDWQKKIAQRLVECGAEVNDEAVAEQEPAPEQLLPDCESKPQPVEYYASKIEALIHGVGRDDLQNAASSLSETLHERASLRDGEGWGLKPSKAALIIEWFIRDFGPQKQFVDKNDMNAQALATILEGAHFPQSLLLPDVEASPAAAGSANSGSDEAR